MPIPDDLDDICEFLQLLQRDRKFLIKNYVSVFNRTTAYVAGRVCNYSSIQDEASREKNWKRAEGIVKRHNHGKFDKDGNFIRKAIPQLPEDWPLVTPIIKNLEAVSDALKPILERRYNIECEMERFAQMLHVRDFIEGICGAKYIGLGVTVGESGNLFHYPAKRSLWHRLGYGMMPGHEAHAYSTWRKLKGAIGKCQNEKADKHIAEGYEPITAHWMAAGYSPQRYGQIYGCVTIPLFLNKAKNKYGQVYAARRAHTLITHPEWYHDKNGKP